jgi:hypothetical protein
MESSSSSRPPNVVFDAFTACWEAKRYYDTGRPLNLVGTASITKGTDRGRLGSDRKGLRQAQGRGLAIRNFRPPFFDDGRPSRAYPSGHAPRECGAASRMLELFTGSDRFRCGRS